MKRIPILLLLSLPLAVIAQPTLTYKTHGLQAGDSHSMQKVSYVSPGATGAQQTWDYSHVSTLANFNIGVENTMPTKDYSNASTIGAPIKERIENGNHGKLQVVNADGATFTYTCNEYANSYEGNDAGGRLVQYEQPITKIRYPFTYQDGFSGSFNAHCFYGADRAICGNMAGNYSSEADAYGKLLLPNNVTLNNTLRVKTRESYVEGMCNNTQVEILKYLWYIPEYRYPVFVTWEITSTYENGQTSTLNESFLTTASLEGIQADPDVNLIVNESSIDQQLRNTTTTTDVTYSVYPNPYNSYFHVTYTLEKETMVDIALFTASGNYITHLVKNTKQTGVQHITYNPRSGNSAGFYFLRMTFNGKVYVHPLVKE